MTHLESIYNNSDSNFSISSVHIANVYWASCTMLDSADAAAGMTGYGHGFQVLQDYGIRYPTVTASATFPNVITD